MNPINLSEISRLEQITKNEDIKSLSHAIFPGTHCPLFGVAMIASFIEDLVVLVAGTQECTYYAKNFAHGRQKGKDNFFSVVANKNDVTFGMEKKLKDVIIEIDKTIKPKAIMLVSTCVLELIGEDCEAIGLSLEDEIDAKILVVPTEHFKCNSHIPGMERSLEKLITLMEDCETDPNSVNILGHRQHGVEESELMKALLEEGININSVIPSSCTIEELKTVPRGKLNIVTDFIALPLAKKMKERFGIPFVDFGKSLTVDRLKASYSQIEKELGVKLLEKLKGQEDRLKELILEARQKLSGKTFIYGNTPMMAFEVSSFLCDLGMEPSLIQVRELYENDHLFMDEIKKHNYNPYISRIANIAPMQFVYDSLKPNFYLGHENPMNLMKRNIVQVTMDDATKKLGYEVPILVITKLLKSIEAQQQMPMAMMKMMVSRGGKKHGIL